MFEQSRKYSYGLAVTIIIIAGFLLRLKLFTDNPSFWFDESALGFNVLELSYKNLFGILHLQQVAPPLFLIVSKIFANIFGASDMTLRLFPFISGFFSLIMFWFVLSNNFQNKQTIITGLLLFCFNIQMVKYSSEFKPYIVEVLATCIILYIFGKLSFDWSNKKLFATGIMLSVIPWFTFISVITVSAAYLVSFSRKNYKKWLIFLLPFSVSAILFAIYYHNVSSFYSEFMTYFFRHHFLSSNNFFKNIFDTLGFLFNVKTPILHIFMIISGFICCFVSKKNGFFLKFSLLVIILNITLGVLHKYPMYSRFELYLYPLILIIILCFFDKLYELKNKFACAAAILIILFLLLPPTTYLVKISFEKTGKRDCAELLMKEMSKRIKPNDEIIVDTLSTPDFLYYNKYYKFENIINMNIEQKNNRILYKYNKDTPLPIEKGKKYWFFSPWRSGFYDDINYEYNGTCEYGGKILYIDGNKQ